MIQFSIQLDKWHMNSATSHSAPPQAFLKDTSLEHDRHSAFFNNNA
jgi:hypothetical protein